MHTSTLLPLSTSLPAGEAAGCCAVQNDFAGMRSGADMSYILPLSVHAYVSVSVPVRIRAAARGFRFDHDRLWQIDNVPR